MAIAPGASSDACSTKRSAGRKVAQACRCGQTLPNCKEQSRAATFAEPTQVLRSYPHAGAPELAWTLAPVWDRCNPNPTHFPRFPRLESSRGRDLYSSPNLLSSLGQLQSDQASLPSLATAPHCRSRPFRALAVRNASLDQQTATPPYRLLPAPPRPLHTQPPVPCRVRLVAPRAAAPLVQLAQPVALLPLLLQEQLPHSRTGTIRHPPAVANAHMVRLNAAHRARC